MTVLAMDAAAKAAMAVTMAETMTAMMAAKIETMAMMTKPAVLPAADYRAHLMISLIIIFSLLLILMRSSKMRIHQHAPHLPPSVV